MTRPSGNTVSKPTCIIFRYTTSVGSYSRSMRDSCGDDLTLTEFRNSEVRRFGVLVPVLYRSWSRSERSNTTNDYVVGVYGRNLWLSLWIPCVNSLLIGKFGVHSDTPGF